MEKLSGKWQSGAGGILGHSRNNNYIYNAYNVGEIELINGTSYAAVGGIVGYNEGNLTIENCYNIGILKSSRNVGGIIGNGGGILQNCFYLNNLEEGQGNIVENNAIAINEQQLKGNMNTNGKIMVDILNEYVKIKNKINNIQLEEWKQKDEYPILILFENI